MPSWPTQAASDYAADKAPRLERVEALETRDQVLLETTHLVHVPETVHTFGPTTQDTLTLTGPFFPALGVDLYANIIIEAKLDDGLGGSPAGTATLQILLGGKSSSAQAISGTSYADYTFKTTAALGSANDRTETIINFRGVRTNSGDDLTFRSLYCSFYWSID